MAYHLYKVNVGFNGKSRRVAQEGIPDLKQKLSEIEDFNNYKECAIDGTCGTGKTTLLLSSNRRYQKVNLICPQITAHNNYNVNPLVSSEYALAQTDLGGEGNIWDRSPYSNIAWQIINPLISKFKQNATYQELTYEAVYPQILTLDVSMGIKAALEGIYFLRPVRTLFLINTNYPKMREIVVNRGIATNNIKDIGYGEFVRYCVLQSHVYRYIAELLKMPYFDIGPHLDYHSMNEISICLLRKIVYTGEDLSAEAIEEQNMPEYLKWSLEQSQALMYNESKK